jgi:hypothetical protein
MGAGFLPVSVLIGRDPCFFGTMTVVFAILAIFASVYIAAVAALAIVLYRPGLGFPGFGDCALLTFILLTVVVLFCVSAVASCSS